MFKACEECGSFIKEDNYNEHDDGMNADILCHECGHEGEVETTFGRLSSRSIEDDIFFQMNPQAQRQKEMMDRIDEGVVEFEIQVSDEAASLLEPECERCGTAADSDENTWGVWQAEDGARYCPDCFVHVVEHKGQAPKHPAGRVWLEHRDELEDYDELFEMLREPPKEDQ